MTGENECNIFDFDVEGGQRALAAFDNSIVYGGLDDYYIINKPFLPFINWAYKGKGIVYFYILLFIFISF